MRLADDVAKQDGDEAALGSSGLCNGQPYPGAPAAPVPECPAGCARAQGLETAWKRDSHGTGIGHSSSEAFWIPQRPPSQAGPVRCCLRLSSLTAHPQFCLLLHLADELSSSNMLVSYGLMTVCCGSSR